MVFEHSKLIFANSLHTTESGVMSVVGVGSKDEDEDVSNADEEVSSSLLRNMSLPEDGNLLPRIVSISAMSSRYENVWLLLGSLELENNF